MKNYLAIVALGSALAITGCSSSNQSDTPTVEAKTATPSVAPARDNAEAKQADINAKLALHTKETKENQKPYKAGDTVTLTLQDGETIHSITDPSGQFGKIEYQIDGTVLQVELPSVDLVRTRAIEVKIIRPGETEPSKIRTIRVNPNQ